MPELADGLTERVIGFAIDIHRQLGPGLLESVYEQCLCLELQLSGVAHRRQLPVPVNYKSVRLEAGYRLDLLVEDRLVVEVKAIDQLLPIHSAQILTYMRLLGAPTGLLLNFNSFALKDGIRRLTLKPRQGEPNA